MRDRFPVNCQSCPYRPTGTGAVAPDPITLSTQLIIMGRDPGRQEAARGWGYVGRAGELLRRAERLAGLATPWIPREGDGPGDWVRFGELTAFSPVCHANVTWCRPPGDKWAGGDTARSCWARNGSRVDWSSLPMLITGSEALQALTGYNLPPLTSRGSLVPLTDGLRGTGLPAWATYTLHPSFLARQERASGGEETGEEKNQVSLLPLLVADIHNATAAGGPRVPKVRVVTPGDLLRLLERDAPRHVAVDIEGQGGKPTLIGFAWSEEQAYCCWWSEAVRPILDWIWAYSIPLFHNASFDLSELAAIGIQPPTHWADTIVLAAIADQELPLGLGSQALTHLPGWVSWKKLVDHDNLHAVPFVVREHRRLVSAALDYLNRPKPVTWDEWYVLYNGMDCCATYGLYTRLMAELGPRADFYTQTAQPLQPILFDMGRRGLPVNPAAVLQMKESIGREVEDLDTYLKGVGKGILDTQLITVTDKLATLEAAREAERTAGQRKFSRAKEVAALRTQHRNLLARIEEGFNYDSPPQRKVLLFDYLGLPVGKTTDSGEPSTGEEVLSSLLNRLERGTIKPKRGIDSELAKRTLQALIDVKARATLTRTYLVDPANLLPPPAPGLWPRLETEITQHRARSGRFASGVDTSDPDKGTGTKKVKQIQNWPKEVRAVVQPDPGHVFVAGDWSNLEWAVFMWFTLQYDIPNRQFHQNLLTQHNAGDFDAHCWLASFWCGESYEDLFAQHRAGKPVKPRKQSKPFTHGLSYGGAATTMGRKEGIEDKLSYRVAAAHEQAFRVGPTQRAIVDEATRLHYTETPWGWRCYYWDYRPKPNELIANTVQGTAADIMKQTLLRLNSSLPPATEILTTTHDSFLLQTPQEYARHTAAWLKTTMEHPFDRLNGQWFRADVKVGNSWQEVS